MKTIPILGFLCAVCVSACGTAPTSPSASLFTLSGRVTESAPTDTVPVAGAKVEVLNGSRGGTVVTTDAEGRFTLTGASGAFDLIIRATGYEDATVRVDGSGADVSRSFGLRPMLRTVAETIGTPSGPPRAPTSFFRNVHHDGMIVVSRLSFRSSPLTRTIEIWNGQQLVGAATIYKPQYSGVLILRVSGGVRYEIRITGGDWGAVTIESPS